MRLQLNGTERVYRQSDRLPTMLSSCLPSQQHEISQTFHLNCTMKRWYKRIDIPWVDGTQQMMKQEGNHSLTKKHYFMVFSLVWLTKGNFEAIQRAAICHEQQTSWQQRSSSRNVTPSACLCAIMSVVLPSKYPRRTDNKSGRKHGVKGLLSNAGQNKRFTACLPPWRQRHLRAIPASSY